MSRGVAPIREEHPGILIERSNARRFRQPELLVRDGDDGRIDLDDAGRARGVHRFGVAAERVAAAADEQRVDRRAGCGRRSCQIRVRVLVPVVECRRIVEHDVAVDEVVEHQRAGGMSVGARLEHLYRR